MNQNERVHIAKCSKHGFYVTYRANGVCRHCERERQAIQAADIRAVGVPRQHSGHTLKNFLPETQDQRNALGFVRMYAENFSVVREDGLNLAICGPHFTGKTHLAVGIITHVLQSGYTARYIDLDARSRPTGRDAAADLLVIDNFTSQAQAMRLGGVLYGRGQANLPTILVASVAKDIFTLTLGTRYTELMRRNGFKCLNCNWEPMKI